jgi:hypothetical protein
MASDLNIPTPYTSLVPSARWRTVRHGRERPPRFGLGVRMRAFIKRAELDGVLADGADPRESPELALRAHQLAKPDKRIRFARAIERVVSDAGSPEPQILLGVYRRDPVLKNRLLLRALADRLRAGAPVRLRGLAMVDLMLYRSDGPLYGAQSAVQLEREVADVVRALEPEPVDPVLSLSRARDSSEA